MRKLFIIIVVVSMIAPAWIKGDETEVEVTGQAEDASKILGLLDTYVKAFEEADADLAQSLVWLDDERFTEIEDMIAYPFGMDTYLEIMDWIRENAEPGKQEMIFHDPQVFFLADDVAYLITIQEIINEESKNLSRVTLILLKKDGEWKIIHGHFSGMPKQK